MSNVKAELSYGSKRILVYCNTNLESIKKEIDTHDDNTYYILITHFFKTKYQSNKINEVFKTVKERTFVLLSDGLTKKNIEYYDFDILRLNYACLHSDDSFIIEDEDKEYDLVISSRPASYKRIELLKKASNIFKTIWLTGAVEDDIPDIIKSDKILRVYQKDMHKYINKAKVGVILSEFEGSCLASTEYLMCGIPVISTKTFSGRSLYYNSYNSIICEPTEESVLEACSTMLDRLKKGQIDSNKIRNDCLAVSREERNRLTNYLNYIFSTIGADINMDKFMKDKVFQYIFNYHIMDSCNLEMYKA